MWKHYLCVPYVLKKTTKTHYQNTIAVDLNTIVNAKSYESIYRFHNVINPWCQSKGYRNHEIM